MTNSDQLVDRCAAAHTFLNVKLDYDHIVFHRGTRTFNTAEEELIEREWDVFVNAKKVNKNDALVALTPERTHVEGRELHVEGYVTDFKHWRTTRERADVNVWLTGPSAVTRVYSGGETFYVIGERPTTILATGGPLEFVPGGFLKAAHFSEEDPFRATLYKELKEETGIPRDRVTAVHPFWCGEVPKYKNVCVDYLIDVERSTPEQIEKLFREQSHEHTALYFVPHHTLREYAEENLSRFNDRGKCSLEYLLRRGIVA